MALALRDLGRPAEAQPLLVRALATGPLPGGTITAPLPARRRLGMFGASEAPA